MMAKTNNFCTQCGSKLAEQGKFCNFCGAPQTTPPPQPFPGGREEAPPVPPGPPAPPVPPAVRSVSPNPVAPPAGNRGAQEPQPARARGGCGKLLLVLLLLAVLGAGAMGALLHFEETGAITLPWSEAPDPKLYVGRWQAVSRVSNGKTVDVSKDTNKVHLDLAQVANSTGLNGKITLTADVDYRLDLQLKPVKDAKKYEGTATRPANPKQTATVHLEYTAATKDMVLTIFAPADKANEPPAVIHFKKI